MSSRRVDVVAPPGVLDVPLQLDAERAVVPEAVEAAVDLARREDEPPALAERDQLVHVHRVVTFPRGMTLAGPAPGRFGNPEMSADTDSRDPTMTGRRRGSRSSSATSREAVDPGRRPRCRPPRPELDDPAAAPAPSRGDASESPPSIRRDASRQAAAAIRRRSLPGRQAGPDGPVRRESSASAPARSVSSRLTWPSVPEQIRWIGRSSRQAP